jgi:PPOX class probable F420-dependent enzyme
MATTLTPEQRKFFEDANVGYLGTVMPDGSPHVTPVWVDVDEDGTILVNSSIGRVKEQNVRRDPRVSLAVADHGGSFAQVVVRGEVVEATEEGAEEHIHAVAGKYLGEPHYPWLQPGERRVIFRIRPDRVSSMA